MIKYLTKTVEEYWIHTLEEVEEFHTEVQKDGEKQGYQVSSFGYVEKPIKDSGEIIDSYFIVKVTKGFDDNKTPMESPLVGIDYNRGGNFLA